MNQIMVIFPYKFHGQWVFDDPSKGLDKEALVSGIDTMLDELTASMENSEKGVKVFFSGGPFPDYQLKLDWRREEYGGNWYYSDKLGYEGWLCPALFKYFDKAPQHIFAAIKPQ
ncbi:MAG: DUF6717 family protein [Verrucomicrobiales bacterium]